MSQGVENSEIRWLQNDMEKFGLEERHHKR